MPSTYTVNLGIEKPATGEQSGTWGDTVNDNSNILDEAINGAVTITLSSAGSSGSPNSITITNGASSTGRNKWIEFGDGGDLGAAAYVQLTPNDAEKICNIRNSLSGSRSIFIFQGTYSTSNDLEIAAGTDVVVKFNGGGTGATVVNVYANLKVDGIVATTADINGGTIDATVIGGSTAAAVTGTTVVANTSVNIAGDGATVTGIKDEDNMASNSATKLATQQSIKAYVDSQVGTVDTLAEILANGNTTGSTDIDVDAAQKVQFRDAAIYINSSVDGQLDIVADTEIQIAATTIDINGAIVASGEISAASLDISGDVDIDGTLNVDAIDIDGAVQIDATLTVGVDDTGYDVKFYGATGGAYMLWDESADDLILAGAGGLVVAGNVDFNGDLDVDGTTNLDVVDIDGAVDMASTLAVGGVVTIPVGSVSAPSLTFAGDSDTGIFRRLANTIDITTGGTLRLEIDSAGNFIVQNAFYAEGGAVFNENSYDVDFRVESDTITHALFVEGSSGNVGINDSSPYAPLSVTTTGTLPEGQTWSSSVNMLTLRGDRPRAGFSTVATTGGNAYDGDMLFYTMYYPGTGDYTWYERMRLTSKGALITTPVAGGHAVFNDGSVDADFRVESNGASHMLFVDGGTNRVGIGGATAPATTLEVLDHTSGNFNGAIHVGGVGSSRRLVLEQTDVTTYKIGGTGSSSITQFVSGGSAGVGTVSTTIDADGTLTHNKGAIFNETGVDADFRVESDTYTHALFVQGSDGNVGIGLTPTEHLHVGGRANAVLELQSSTTTGTGRVNFNDGANSGQILYSHNTNTMDFYSGGSYAMRLTSTGITAPQGIIFGTTGGAVTSKTLDDYEEGTFTPALYFGSVISSGAAYGNAVGTYTKIGNRVTYSLYLLMSNKGTTTGQFMVGGFPFAANAGGGAYNVACPAIMNLISHTGQISCYQDGGFARFYSTATNGVRDTMDQTDISNTSEIMMSGTYMIA